MTITKRMKFMIPEEVLNDNTFMKLFNELFNICSSLQNENDYRFKNLKIANELANLISCYDQSNAVKPIIKYKEACKYFIKKYKKNLF